MLSHQTESKASDTKESKKKTLHPALTEDIPKKIWFHIAYKTRRATSIISLIDTMLGLAERRWTPLKNFHEHELPYWGNGIFYMLPSFVTWSVLTATWLKRKPDEVMSDLSATKSFLKQFKKLKNTSNELEKHEHEKHQFHGLLHAFNYPGNNVYIDILLGNLVLGLRFLCGFLFMLQTLQIVSPEKNKDITDISSDALTVINAFYTAYMMLRNSKGPASIKADDFFYSTHAVNKAIRKFKEYGERNHRRKVAVEKAVNKFKEMGALQRQRKAEESEKLYNTITPLQKFSKFKNTHVIDIPNLEEPLLTRSPTPQI